MEWSCYLNSFQYLILYLVLGTGKTFSTAQLNMKLLSAAVPFSFYKKIFLSSLHWSDCWGKMFVVLSVYKSHYFQLCLIPRVFLQTLFYLICKCWVWSRNRKRVNITTLNLISELAPGHLAPGMRTFSMSFYWLRQRRKAFTIIVHIRSCLQWKTSIVCTYCFWYL